MKCLQGVVPSLVLSPLNKWCLSGALVSPGWERGATEENKRLLAQLPCSLVSTDLKGGLIIYFSVVSCGKMNALELYVEPEGSFIPSAKYRSRVFGLVLSLVTLALPTDMWRFIY